MPERRISDGSFGGILACLEIKLDRGIYTNYVLSRPDKPIKSVGKGCRHHWSGTGVPVVLWLCTIGSGSRKRFTALFGKRDLIAFWLLIRFPSASKKRIDNV
jgi:hypothetical protein